MSTNIQPALIMENPASSLTPELIALFNNRVITPDDAEYERARTVHAGAVDRRPAAIVRVANASDVSQLVSLARETSVELAVRSGGHSLAGHGVTNGGVLLDLSGMKGLQIDVNEMTAWAETGLTAGEYTIAAGAHGLATGFGDTASVGIGGLTLGGGVGFLVRKYGMTIDHLLAAEIVTADGKLRVVDHESHPDLFWAIRGGGGNFGVATRFKFRLHAVNSILGGMLILPATADVIAGFIAEAEAAPDELLTIVNIMPAPPIPFLPEEAHGKLVLMATLVHAGDANAGQRVIAPFRKLATPLADLIKPMRYPEIYPQEDHGSSAIIASRAMFVDSVDRSAAEKILAHLNASTASMAFAQLRVLGGAMARIPAGATAFAHRSSRIMVNLMALFRSPGMKSVHEAWVADFAAALQQEDGGVYVNFLGDEGEARIHAAYPEETWKRLASIKARYDPTNFFHLNHNIQPRDQAVAVSSGFSSHRRL